MWVLSKLPFGAFGDGECAMMMMREDLALVLDSALALNIYSGLCAL